MRSVISKLRSSEFLRHNAIFFAGSLVVGALNYFYYPVLGRLLEPAAFGEVQTIVALFLQIGIFLTVLGMLTVNIVANHGDEPKGQQTMLELEKLALLISLLAFGLTALFGPWLQHFFNFDSVAPFLILALAIVVSVPATFRMAYLRGKQRFGWASASQLVGAAAKLVFSVALVIAGFGTVGAIAGLVLAQFVSFAYAAVKARHAGFGPSLRSGIFKLPDMALILPELKYAALVLVGSLTVTALYSIDIIAVKHYFDAHTAGLYAGIATVARIIFFLTASIAQVLLPAVKLSNPPGQNRQVLVKSAYLTAGIGGTALLVFWAAPELVMRILMGQNYVELAPLLPRLSLVILIVSLLNLVMLYYVALRQYAIGFVGILGIGITCGLVGTYHDSPQAVVDSMLFGSAATAVILVGVRIAARRKSKREGNRNVQ